MSASVFSPSFMGTRMMSVEASAQYLGPGAILEPMYDAEIHDWNRRTTFLWQNMRKVPAKDQPFKYHEQASLPGAPKMVDPRNLSYNAQVAPVRQEKLGYVKAAVDSIDFGMFDIEMAQQQGRFPQLDGKDLEDTVTNMLMYLDEQLLIGTAPSVITAPGVNVNYCGLTNQLAALTPVAAAANVVDAIQTACVNWMTTNKKFVQKPNAIHIHPVLIDKINKQEAGLERHVDKMEIVPGVVVTGIMTVFGLLPLVPNLNCPEAQIVALNDAYETYIVTDSMLEFRYVTAPEPRVFKLGLVNDMATKYTIVLFGAPVAIDARRPDDNTKPLQHAKILIAKA